MSPVTPNMAGFKEAEMRLTSLMGEDVTVIVPSTTTYPPGTKMDPETGKPMDPWVAPTASGQTETQMHCSIAFRPITTNRAGIEAQADETVFGVVNTNSAVLIVPDEDEWPKLEGAESVIAKGVLWKIEDIVHDSPPDRKLVFLERR